MRRFLIGAAAAAVVALAAGCATTDAGSPSSASSDASSGASSGASSQAPATGGAASGDESDADCEESGTWDTAEESAEPSTADPLYLVRVGQHDCFDRVVLDVNGQADVGYLVKYVPV